MDVMMDLIRTRVSSQSQSNQRLLNIIMEVTNKSEWYACWSYCTWRSLPWEFVRTNIVDLLYCRRGDIQDIPFKQSMFQNLLNLRWKWITAITIINSSLVEAVLKKTRSNSIHYTIQYFVITYKFLLFFHFLARFII